MTQEKRIHNDAYADRIRVSSALVGTDTPVEAMLANSLRDGKPLADDGSLYDTVQAAENAASGFVFVPPGSFTNSVTIDTNGLTLYGSGSASRIEPSGVTSVTVNVPNVTIQNVSVTSSNNSNANAIVTFGDYTTITNVLIDGSGKYGILVDTCDYNTISSSYFQNTGNDSVRISGDPCKYNVVTNCISISSGSDAFRSYGPSDDGLNSADNVFAYNIAISPANNGFVSDDEGDNIIVGNRFISTGGNGIYLFDGDDNIVVNNRISDSGGDDISDNTFTSVIEGNKTGSAN